MTSAAARANQLSPNSSDDEIFLPNRRQSAQNGLALQRYDDSCADVDWETAQFGQHCETQPPNPSSESEEPNWNDSKAHFHSTRFPSNSNNNRPGAQYSISNPLSSRSHDSDGVVSEPDEAGAACRALLRERQPSIVDGLLHEIYDRWHGTRADSFDSDTFTECSSTSEVFLSRWDTYEVDERRHSNQLNRTFLESQSTVQLRRMVADMQRSISQVSGRLVRQLRRRDRRLAKLQRNCDVVTAILQAASLKRQVDTKMKFSLEPPPGQSAFEQWKDAMKAVGRLPMGIPPEFRRKVWLSLADHYIGQLKLDWHKTVRFAFNERSNPDDDKLGLQIVKDLHRTGCSSFSGQDNEEDRAVLKRVLLAYARWNKRVGYCQGFNVIAALLLDVTDRKEDDALKVMIYLIDRVLPESYFDNNLRALSVDMAVFRDLLRLTFPTLSKHLDRLQHAAQDVATGANYEPPLTNVFTMQWFLTLFATCLPKDVVLRVWDAILLEGSEVLLRTALSIWGKLARRIMIVTSADEFYSLMGELSSDMMQGGVFDADDIVKAIYSLAPFPFPQMAELREKYTYNIRPFSNQPTPSKQASRVAKAVLYSDDDELDDDEIRAIACFPGMGPVQASKGRGDLAGGSAGDISLVGPGVYGSEPEVNSGREAVYLERMSTDITALKLQYEKLRQRQRQAHIIIAAASSAKRKVEARQKVSVLVPHIETPTAMNHLFVGKAMSGRNRLVTDGPRITTSRPASRNSLLTKQLQAVATAQASSKHRPKTSASTQECATPHIPPCQTEGQEVSEEPPSASATDSVTGDAEDGSRNSRYSGQQYSTVQDLQESVENGNGDICNITLRREPDIFSILSENKETAEGSDTSVFGDEDAQTLVQDTGVLLSHHSAAKEMSNVFQDQDRLKCIEDCWQKSSALQKRSEDDSGIVLSSPTPGSTTSSPEKKAAKFQDISQQLRAADLQECQVQGNKLDQNAGPHPSSTTVSTMLQKQVRGESPFGTKTDSNHHYRKAIARSFSAPQGTSSDMSHTTTLPSSTSTAALCSQQPSSILLIRQHHPSSQACQLPSSSPVKTGRPFDPFPVKHINVNRARTGLKLGLYTPSVLEQIQGQLLGGLQGKKSRTGSS